MNLPPLPHPHCYDSIQDFGCFDEIQMREYGALCRKQALEEAEEHFRRKHELCKNRHNYWHCAAIEIRKLLTLP